MANKQKELINILKAELTLLSQEILQNIHQTDISDLYKNTRKLYEKIAAIHVLDKKIKNKEELLELISKNNTEKEILNNNNKKTKSEKEKISSPISTDQIDAYQQEITFVPKQKETKETKTVSVTNSYKKMNIGLNDRIAFIKNLFNGDDIAYLNAIEKLNAYENYEDALKYIYNNIKPQYNNWEGKDEYEFRLLQLLELKFN